MNVERHQAVVIGGGPAGLAAAIQLKQKGIDDVVVLEREHRTGGILRQCIHDGFGLTRFGETLSGPEYAQRFVDQAEELGITCLTDTTVLSLEADRTVTASGHAGIYTAGVAQEYINLCNLMVGREVVILGSGDIGLIMARRMTLEGAHVKDVYEVQPYPRGLPRNIEQCLNDYNIPLHLSHTVTDIHGRERLEGMTISQVDERFRPIPGTEERVDCDTLILSVGLIPAGDIANGSGLAVDGRTKGAFVDEHYQTSIPGVFSAGNVLHVHDLVDFVSLEAEALAAAAAEYLQKGSLPPCPLEVKAGANVGHVIPQHVSGTRSFTLSLRVRQPLKKVTLTVTQNGREVLRRKFPKALPAEMIQLTVPAEKLETAGDLEVSVQWHGPLPASSAPTAVRSPPSMRAPTCAPSRVPPAPRVRTTSGRSSPIPGATSPPAFRWSAASCLWSASGWTDPSPRRTSLPSWTPSTSSM